MTNPTRSEQRPYPIAPDCPAWCTCHDGAVGWDIHPSAITKTCRRIIECDGGCQVEIEVFASVEAGELVVAPPAVRVHVGDALGVGEAMLLAEVLTRAAEVIEAPEIVAA